MATHMLIETGRASRLAACDTAGANHEPGTEDARLVTCPACRALFPAAEHEPTEECGESIRQTGACEHGVAAPGAVTWETESDRMYREQVAGVARRLRELADEVERGGLRVGDATEAHVVAASRVVHAVTWGVANLDLDGLVRMAADATSARAQQQGDGEQRCVHCLAVVTLVDGQWSDGHPRYPFYCPKALNLTHRVLDVTA